jgi:hypothetical protein
MFQLQRFGYPRDAQQLTVDSICCRGNIRSALTLRSNGFIFRVSCVQKETVA